MASMGPLNILLTVLIVIVVILWALLITLHHIDYQMLKWWSAAINQREQLSNKARLIARPVLSSVWFSACTSQSRIV